MSLFKRRAVITRTSQWSSHLGFILATSGAAVGLGNIWMFPYITGMNGGGAFVLIYFCCIAMIGIPIMMSEAMIGHFGALNPIDSIDKITKESGASRNWKYLAVWGGLALIFILSFYSVVSGWSIGYLFKTLSGDFVGQQQSAISQAFGGFVSNPVTLLIYHTLFLCMTMGVVGLGVEKGLERASKIMMPGLIIILILLVIYGMFTGQFWHSLSFLFQPDFSKITPSVVLSAMGLSFFTLALGASCIVAYASYLPPNTPVTPNVFKIVGLDAFVALLAGLAIFPLVFHFGLEPQAGPGLMFEVLPTAFAQMPGGVLIGAAFFLLLLFAAWTSSISLAEPLVVMLHERLHLSRLQAVLLVGVVAWVMGIAVLLSFNLWSEVKLFGRFTFFDIAVELPQKIILPLGGLGFAILAGFCIDKKVSQHALLLKNPLLFNLWRFLIRYVSPVAIVAVLVFELVK